MSFIQTNGIMAGITAVSNRTPPTPQQHHQNLLGAVHSVVATHRRQLFFGWKIADPKLFRVDFQRLHQIAGDLNHPIPFSHQRVFPFLRESDYVGVRQ